LKLKLMPNPTALFFQTGWSENELPDFGWGLV
jgi:hypothetical protein